MTTVDTPDSPLVTRPTRSPSLLGQIPHSLRLRLSPGLEGSQRIVDFPSGKCFVGSAAGCDLRVEDPDVAPLECLILRGAAHNIVRWYVRMPHTSDGAFLEDEILDAGEPLQIGPVELEVLVDEIFESEVCESSGLSIEPDGLLAEYVARLERLEYQLATLQSATDDEAFERTSVQGDHETSSTITALAQQLAALQARTESERHHWADEQAELEALLEARSLEFATLQVEVRRLGDELLTVRQEYADALATHTATSDELATVSRQLAERARYFEEQESAWTAERQELLTQLQEHADRWRSLDEQLDEQSSRYLASEAARQAAETCAEQLRQAVDQLTQRLADQLAENESIRQQWAAERETFESELTQVRQQLSESVAHEAEQREQREADLRQSWHREREALQSQIEEADGRAQSAVEQLISLRHSPINRAADMPCEMSEYRADEATDVDEPTGNVAVGLAGDLVDDLADDVARDDSGELLSQAISYPFSELAVAEDPIERLQFSNPAIEDDDPDDAADLEFASMSPVAPVSTADVLARLGQATDWDDDDDDGADVVMEFSTSPVMPHSPAPVAPAVEEEESIEDYMARLMQRMRAGDSGAPVTRASQCEVERTPVTEYQSVPQPIRPVRQPELPKINEDEYKPRSHAPEGSDKLHAMRSLANDSARTAIASHAKRNWSTVMKLQLLVSVFTFVAVLASVIFFWGEPLLMGLGALVGFSVLLYWGRTAMAYRKLFLDSLMLDSDPPATSCSTEDAELSNQAG